MKLNGAVHRFRVVEELQITQYIPLEPNDKSLQ